MTSSLERDKVIPLRTSFDEESFPIKRQKKSKNIREELIYPLREKGLDFDDRKFHIGKEHRKKREKKGEESKGGELRIRHKQEKWRPEPESKTETRHTPSPYLFPPQRKSLDEEGSHDEIELKRGNEKLVNNAVGVPMGNSFTVQPKSDFPPDEQRRSFSLKDPRHEKRWEENSDIIMIRAAIKRDLFDDKSEPERGRCRHDRGSTSGNNGRKEEKALKERHNRETCPKNDYVKDACTATRDGLLAPCQYLFAPKKDSLKDLSESKKEGDSGGGKYDRRCCREFDKFSGNDYDERNVQDYRRKNAAIFSGHSFSSSPRNENAEGRGDDWKGTIRRPSADEITQLKNDLTNLQTELDRLKECLKAAAIAAEKNKCTITRMKEHFRCNFPCCLLDCARIREKLKNCSLIKMRICRDFKVAPNEDCWKKDFECLKNELNTIKGELEKIRRDKK